MWGGHWVPAVVWVVVARGIVDLLVDVWFVVAGCLVLLLVWGCGTGLVAVGWVFRMNALLGPEATRLGLRPPVGGVGGVVVSGCGV